MSIISFKFKNYVLLFIINFLKKKRNMMFEKMDAKKDNSPIKIKDIEKLIKKEYEKSGHTISVDMINKFEEETNRNAIYYGRFTIPFLKYARGEKVYSLSPDKKRINITLPVELLERFDNYLSEMENGSSEQKQKRSKTFLDLMECFLEIVKLQKIKDHNYDIKYIVEKCIKLFRKDLNERIFSNRDIGKFFNDILFKFSSNQGNLLRRIEDSKLQADGDIKTILKENISFLEVLQNEIVPLLLKEKIYDVNRSKYDILIFDDDVSNSTSKFLKDKFNPTNISIYDVLNFKDFVLFLRKYLPRIILIDVRIPDIEGTEICRRLKNNDDLKDVLIIVYSADPSVSPKEVVDYYKADYFFTKPEILKDLPEIIKKHLN